MKKRIIITAVLCAVFWLTVIGGLCFGVRRVMTAPLIPTPGIPVSPEMTTAAAGPPAAPTACETEPPPEPVYIRLSFIGDCMLATNLGGEYDLSFNKLAREVEPSYFFENFIDMFAADDWTIANLENVFTDNPAARTRAKGYSPAYWYKSTAANTAILTEGSVDVVSLSNNHSEDYGAIGYADTRAALEAAGVLWGDDDNIVLLSKDDFTIALYCCTFYYSSRELDIAKKLAEVDADYKIVYFHGGTERTHVPDSWKAAGARYLIDEGADLVVGHHPHVLQPIEIYKGKTIVHSLGNFVFGGSRKEENRTIVYRHQLKLLEGEIVEITDEVIPCYVYTELYQPDIITDPAEIDAVMAFLAGEKESPLS